MTIEYYLTTKSIFSIVDYIGNMLNYIPEYIKGGLITSAEHHLFDIVQDATKLSWTYVDLFHRFFVQLLYLSNKEHTYIQLIVSFLWTILRDPDIDDYKNMEKVIFYTQYTIVLPLIMSIKSRIIKWYVDAEFAVHK